MRSRVQLEYIAGQTRVLGLHQVRRPADDLPRPLFQAFTTRARCQAIYTTTPAAVNVQLHCEGGVFDSSGTKSDCYLLQTLRSSSSSSAAAEAAAATTTVTGS